MFDWGYSCQIKEVIYADQPKESLSFALSQWRHEKAKKRASGVKKMPFSLYKASKYNRLGTM